MPRRYTEAKIAGILEDLDITPLDGKVYTQEAARILTYRAKAEYGIDHEYSAGAVRKHSKQLHAEPATNEHGKPNSRLNLIPVQRLFLLRIAPKRTNRSRWKSTEVQASESAAPSQA